MPTINLKFIQPPITWGCDYARLLQGVNVNGQAPTAANPAPFEQTDTLAATVSLGQNLPSLFSPAVTWLNPSLCQVTFGITAAQAQQLSVDATYLVVITAARAGKTYPIVEGYLQVLPNAGTQANATPPDLVTVPYVAALLSQLALNEPELDLIPSLITAASWAIRTYCVRMFVQAQYSEILPVELDGSIMLNQIPVATVQRIQTAPKLALSLSNSTAVSSWTSLATTGDPINGLTINGLTLNWQQVGVYYSATFPWTTGLTIGTLASQINATSWTGATIVGTPPGNPPYGWNATAENDFVNYAATDIYDAVTGKGASNGDQPNGAANLRVLSQDLGVGYPDPDMGQLTGHWYVGRQGWGNGGGGWGWGWGWGDSGSNRGAGTGFVRVQYVGGLSSVPAIVQSATAEYVKLMLARLRTDLILESETAGEYSYRLAKDLLVEMPDYIRGPLNRFRITNA